MEGNGIPALGEISRGLIGSLESPLTTVHTLDNIKSASPPLADASGILSLTQLPSTCTSILITADFSLSVSFFFFLPDDFVSPDIFFSSFAFVLPLMLPRLNFFVFTHNRFSSPTNAAGG